MTKTRSSRTTLLGLLLAGALSAAASAQSGREIMQEQRRRHQPRTEETRVEMKLVDSRGREREREMMTISQRGEDGLSKTLVKFLAPSDVRDTGLLTWERPEDQEDDQWLYLPAARSVRRIAGGGKKNAFMGTDFAYEDLRPENLAAHEYELLRQETVDGQPTWVVEAVPATDKEEKDSGYAKRIFWIRKDNYLTVKTELYDDAGNLAKVATMSDHENIEGDMWRSNQLRMETLDRGTATVLTVVDRTVNQPVEESLLTEQGLRRPAVG